MYRGWQIVGVSFLSLFIHGAATSYLFGVLVVPMEDDLGWTRTELVLALTLATFVTAGFGMLIGGLFDKHGARTGMTLSAILGGFSLIGLAFINAQWQYYLLLGIGVGIARTGLENIGPRTAIANWFIRKRAAAFAWFSGGRAVFGFAMVPIFALIVERSSWRIGWVTLGVMELLILAPLAWIIVRRKPEDFGLLPDNSQPIEQGNDKAATPVDIEVSWTRKEAIRTKSLWFVVFAFVLTGFPATGIIANMVPYFTDEGLSYSLATTAFAFYGFGAIFGRPFWGFIASRFGVHVGMTFYGLAYGIAISMFTLASNPVTLFAATWPLGLIIGGSQQLQAQAWPDYFGRKHVGSINGFTILLITPAIAAGPLIPAAVHDSIGTYIPVFAAYAFTSFIAAGFFFLAKPPKK
ncbi:MAG: MFS transporter [SAR202 cluster bacterium]|nr:MFS transporter [SAR202 cluster bacterium]|tara:strand:- start:2413 stop:3636 length:1224 start_codon:yes stop_codon:yes gene_type:complete